jgi:AcrR family transcriptional regulator
VNSTPPPVSPEPPRTPTLSTEFSARLRERALDAASDAALEQGWQQVRLADVARRSQVARATLYRHFGGKDGLAEALVGREVDRVLVRVHHMLQTSVTWETGLRSALQTALRSREDQPLLAAVLEGRHGNTALLPLLTVRGAAHLAAARALLRAFLRVHHPHVAADLLDTVADALVRVTVSHLALPDQHRQDTVDQLHRLAGYLLIGRSR